MIIRDKWDRKVAVNKVSYVDGDEGVFAIAQDSNDSEIFHLLGGDDGHWWVMGTYHKHWLKGIKDAVVGFS